MWRLEDASGLSRSRARRSALARVYSADGHKNVYSTMGLQTSDPEYRPLTFIAGGAFSPSNEKLEVIVTAALLSDLFADAGRACRWHPALL
jgi:hypothetical protein